jgi:hypothetical protein
MTQLKASNQQLATECTVLKAGLWSTRVKTNERNRERQEREQMKAVYDASAVELAQKKEQVTNEMGT